MKGYLKYCSNLDNEEYNSLWECYHEYSILDWFKEKLSYIMFVLYLWKTNTKDYLMKNLKKSSKIWKQTIGQIIINLSMNKTLLARPRIWILEICIPTAYRLVIFK